MTVAIDTNVLVRLLTADDAAQFKASQKLFARELIFIPDSVILETEWVLRGAFELSREDVCAALRMVCGLPNVTVENPALVAQCLDWHEAGLDFADAFHVSRSVQQDVFKTFDAALIKRAKKVTTLRVEKP